MARRLLSLAVMSGRVGYAYFMDEELKDWQLSRKASQSADDLKEVIEGWLAALSPDAVVTEILTPSSKKRGKTVELLTALVEYLRERKILVVRIVRKRPYKNKYVEAEQFIKRFPALLPWKPERPKFYDNEPNTVAIFEAVALALQVLSDPTTHLAEALG